MPGVIGSLLMSLQPSFRVSSLVLRLMGNNVSNKAFIHNGVRFVVLKNITIGDYSTVNSKCLLDSRYPLLIGKNVMLGRECKVFTLGHDINDAHFSSKGGEVTIYDNVVIFPYSIIMPGVTIGEGAVIYPGSVVTKDVGPREVVGGSPASFIKHRCVDIEYTHDYKMYFGV